MNGSGLADEHAALLLFLNAAPVGLVQCSPNGQVELINAKSASLLVPLSHGAPIGNLFAALEPVAPDLARLCADFEPATGMICEDRRLDFSTALPERNRSWFVSLCLMKLGPERIMAVLADITKQVLDERALRAGESRLRFTLDAAGLGDWEFGLRSGVWRRSAHFDRCFGHAEPPPAWDLDVFVRHVHPDDREEVRRAFQAAVAGAGELRSEFRVIWPDASVHWLAAHGRVEADGGSALRMLGIVFETTAQRLAESHRLRAVQLEAENRRALDASRAKSQFLANMSHELRTPLNAVIGFAELLQSGVVKPDSPKHAQFLGDIATSGRHLLRLINDVLDLAKVESGRLEFFPEAVELGTVIQEVGEILTTARIRKHLRWTVEVDPALTGVVLDVSRLKQVLYNYLSNAIKFTPEHGAIHISALAAGPGFFRLTVADTGVGISPADLPRLFTEFEQLDAGRGKRHEGTGLGLALTQRLVRAQGGEVGVRSTPGKGSEFFFTLPRAPAVAAETEVLAPPRGTDAHEGRVLVIEDDAPGRSLLRSGLEAAGFEVDVAATGAQALECSVQHRYDGITLDLRLPDQPGLDVLASIRSNGPSCAAPVVALSMPANGGAGASFRIANVLGKPLNDGELAAALRRLGLPADGRTAVMVIDDEAMALEAMRGHLAGLGITAACYRDGRLALHALETVQPGVLVLDLTMPQFDGFAVLDALQRLPAWRDLPVLIWTSMLLTDEDYEHLSRSALAILGEGGGALQALLESLRRWRPSRAPCLEHD